MSTLVINDIFYILVVISLIQENGMIALKPNDGKADINIDYFSVDQSMSER